MAATVQQRLSFAKSAASAATSTTSARRAVNAIADAAPSHSPAVAALRKAATTIFGTPALRHDTPLEKTAPASVLREWIEFTVLDQFDGTHEAEMRARLALVADGMHVRLQCGASNVAWDDDTVRAYVGFVCEAERMYRTTDDLDAFVEEYKLGPPGANPASRAFMEKIKAVFAYGDRVCSDLHVATITGEAAKTAYADDAVKCAFTGRGIGSVYGFTRNSETSPDYILKRADFRLVTVKYTTIVAGGDDDDATTDDDVAPVETSILHSVVADTLAYIWLLQQADFMARVDAMRWIATLPDAGKGPRTARELAAMYIASDEHRAFAKLLVTGERALGVIFSYYNLWARVARAVRDALVDAIDAVLAAEAMDDE